MEVEWKGRRGRGERGRVKGKEEGEGLKEKEEGEGLKERRKGKGEGREESRGVWEF